MQDIVARVDLDDEGSWRKALPTAIDYAGHAGVRLHVLSIVPDGMFKMIIVAQLVPEDYERRLLDDAKQRLAAFLKDYPMDGVELEQAARLGSVYPARQRLKGGAAVRPRRWRRPDRHGRAQARLDGVPHGSECRADRPARGLFRMNGPRIGEWAGEGSTRRRFRLSRPIGKRRLS